MAVGGIQVISPDVKLFYKRQKNSAEEVLEISLHLSLSPPLSFPLSLPSLQNITEMTFSGFRWSYCQLLAMTSLSKRKFYRQLVHYLNKYSLLLF